MGIERIFDFGKTLAEEHENYLKVAMVMQFCAPKKSIVIDRRIAEQFISIGVCEPRVVP